MKRSTVVSLTVVLCAVNPLTAQVDGVVRRHDATTQARNTQDVQRATWRRTTIHYGKWLTAGAAVAFTAMAAREHSHSRRDWDALLALCGTADDACTLGPQGRYLRADAEGLYQRSLYYDRRAGKRLLAAQASLLATAALFILDLRPGRGEPDNIPFAPLRVAAEPTRDGARVGLRLTF